MIDIFINPEYIIANVLIKLKEQGKESITISALRDIGVKLQKELNSEEINAVILLSSDKIAEAVHYFSSYFSYINPINREAEIRIKEGVPISKLEQRFVGYLPPEIFKPMLKKISKILTTY